ncbi:MAG TPA: hypothetical protein VLI41_01695 [Phenylobacterium sp.]|uniref:hypothetical protein n=1 Tax=Phenylobacterium sp. TaxID=1871053 RepID=UPI002C09DBD0|nr:hypothetical protein [Phenylobacterium sp.]HSV01892.1 hypothetical protein [Phenylobacterium sp.]
MSSLTHFDPFVWKGQPSTATNDTADGLNRVSRFTTLAGGYDSNGNLTKDGVRTYTYDDENRLTGIPTGPVTTIEAYDPLGRIRARNTSVVGQVYMLEEGDHLIAEYNANGLISSGGNPANPPLRRYVYVPGQNEPIVWYEGTTPYWLHADREGSIIAWSDASGVVTGTGINRTANYGPYGESSTANMPRFGYTGQAFWSESNLYY